LAATEDFAKAIKIRGEGIHLGDYSV
jgi:hypothetical protein